MFLVKRGPEHLGWNVVLRNGTGAAAAVQPGGTGLSQAHEVQRLFT